MRIKYDTDENVYCPRHEEPVWIGSPCCQVCDFNKGIFSNEQQIECSFNDERWSNDPKYLYLIQDYEKAKALANKFVAVIEDVDLHNGRYYMIRKGNKYLIM